MRRSLSRLKLDPVGPVLEEIIEQGCGRGHLAESITNHNGKVLCSSKITHLVSKPLFQIDNGFFDKTRKSSIKHQRNKRNKATHILATGEECLSTIVHVPFESIRFDSSEKIDHVIRQLKGCSFELYVSSGRNIKDKPKVFRVAS